MKKRVPNFLFLFFFSPVFSQTNVGGIISTNTTWTLAGSPYIVTQNTLVDAGVSLTVNSGVIIKFNTNKVLQVKGTLRAIGTASDKIYFTSNAVNPAPGDWGYISFEDQSLDYDSLSDTGCILKNCVIDYGGYGNTAVIRIVSSAPIIDSCSIKNNLDRGLSSSPPFPYQLRVQNCDFGNNGGFATGDFFTFTNNFVHDNGSVGAGYYFSGSIIKDNVFFNNGNFTLYSPLIEKNIFLKNNSYSSEGLIRLGLNFNKNIVSENTSSSNLISIGSQTNGLVLSVNQIVQNKGRILNGGGPGSFINNCVSQNDYLSSLSGFYIGGYPGPLSLNNNNFFNNIRNPQSPYEIKLGPDVNLENNYWGTIEDSVIQSLIYDWFDNVNLGFADYSPYLFSPDTTAPVSPPYNVVKTDLGGGNIQMTWSPNIEEDLAGYKIYWRPKNCCTFYNVLDVGNVGFYTLSGISFSDTIAITAYDSSKDGTDDQFDGNESWFSYDQLYYPADVGHIENIELNAIIFPNPTSGIFSISTPNALLTNVIISNILGEEIFQFTFQNPHSTIDLSKHPSGIYFCTLQTESGISTKKLILNK